MSYLYMVEDHGIAIDQFLDELAPPHEVHRRFEQDQSITFAPLWVSSLAETIHYTGI